MLPAHSVSGFSAGASAALNHLVAYSDVVTGLGIVGGSMYGCNTVPNATFACSGYVSNGAHLENTSIPLVHTVIPALDARGSYLHTERFMEFDGTMELFRADYEDDITHYDYVFGEVKPDQAVRRVLAGCDPMLAGCHPKLGERESARSADEPG